MRQIIFKGCILVDLGHATLEVLILVRDEIAALTHRLCRCGMLLLAVPAVANGAPLIV